MAADDGLQSKVPLADISKYFPPGWRRPSCRVKLPTTPLSFSSFGRQFTSAIDHELRDGTDRTLLQGSDCDWPRLRKQVYGQCANVQMPGAKLQHRTGPDRQIPTGRQEVGVHLQGNRRDAGLRQLESAGAESFFHERALNRIERRKTHGWFIRSARVALCRRSSGLRDPTTTKSFSLNRTSVSTSCVGMRLGMRPIMSSTALSRNA